MKKRSFFTSFIVFLTFLLWGQVPNNISYQGVLTDSGGEIVPDGNYDITLRLYDAASGGSPIWEESQSIAVINGVFNVILGSGESLNLPFDKPYWLGIIVGQNDEHSPRTRLTSSPYSLKAADAEKVGGFEVSPVPTANSLLPLDADGMVPSEALPKTLTVKMDGVQGFDNIDLESNANTEILNISLNDPGIVDVSLNAHLVVEINGDGDGDRYEFSIRRGSLTGPLVALGWWRPGSSAGRQAETIAFGGIDTGITGPLTYYLVGRKFDSDAKDALVFISGLNAIWTVQ